MQVILHGRKKNASTTKDNISESKHFINYHFTAGKIHILVYQVHLNSPL